MNMCLIMGVMSEPVKPRAYNSPLRAEKARLTRRRVLDAAARLFLEHGYPQTTLAAVGAQAGVAADTVLHLFGSKRGLLKEVMDTVIGGDDEDVALLERQGPQAVRAEPDQHRQLAMFAAGMSSQLERVRPLDDILRSAAAVDQDVAALRADLQLRQRRAGTTAVAGWVAANGPLRDSRTIDQASAMIWTLTSPEVHRMFRVDWGWSAQAYQEWLEQTLRRTLLP
jgi:AcrR family transcriptional regulator